uniref:Uncharacterized protein n=1 Tax=Romanomermis culicivorax TaxID=13658 RepID=A0A915L008_ROMCU
MSDEGQGSVAVAPNDVEQPISPAVEAGSNGRRTNKNHETDPLSQPAHEEYVEQTSSADHQPVEVTPDPNPGSTTDNANFCIFDFSFSTDKFKRIDKETFEKKIGVRKTDETTSMESPSGHNHVSLEAGILLQKIFHIFAFILQGILAGFCIANSIFALYTFSTNSPTYNDERLKHAEPYKNYTEYYGYYGNFLLYDIDERFPRYVWRSITFQSGGLSILLYLVALLLNSVATFYDDEFNYYHTNLSTATSADKAYYVARDTKVTLAFPVIKAILTTWAWILLAVRPNTNLLIKHMKQACQNLKYHCPGCNLLLSLPRMLVSHSKSQEMLYQSLFRAMSKSKNKKRMEALDHQEGIGSIEEEGRQLFFPVGNERPCMKTLKPEFYGIVIIFG